MFRVGDEVVCVDADPHNELQDANGGLDGLAEGEHYHIRWIGQDVTRGTTRYVVRLVEIYRELLRGPGSDTDEAYFFAFRFKRPITISKTTKRKVPIKLEGV